jgi:hypothetical protein
VIAFTEPDAESRLPLLADKSAQGPVTTFICQNYACKAPILAAGEAEKKLATDAHG